MMSATIVHRGRVYYVTTEMLADPVALHAWIVRQEKAMKGLEREAPLEPDGRNTSSPYRAELLPPRALLAAAAELKIGEETHAPPANGVPSWTHTPIDKHMGRLLAHALAYMAGDRSEPHLVHILCRAVFMAELEAKENESAPHNPVV